MPSHRADTPADAPTALRTRSSAHPTHPPLQRRRDLRARAAVPGPYSGPAPQQRTPLGGLEWLDVPAPRAVPEQRQAPVSRVAAAWAGAAPVEWAMPAEPAGTTSSLDLDTVGALALDPLFLATPGLENDGLAGGGALAPVQPLRRPRGKDRAKAQTTRRAAKAVAESEPRRSGPGLPQVGIAGALGIATIAVPLAGLGMLPGTRPAAATSHRAAAAAIAPPTPSPLVVPPSLSALADRRLLPREEPVAEVPSSITARRSQGTTPGRASRSAPRSVLPGCDGKAPDVRGVQNGRLPASMLCTLWDPKRQLRSDAAVALAKLNVLYTKRFGHPICFNDAYRSLQKQYQIKALRGGYAARPGTSEHGWGLAVDLCDGVDDGAGSATYTWLRANATAFGWENPTWARPGGSGPYEPWHWEFMPGEQGQSKGD